jgi:hypothetical protein
LADGVGLLPAPASAGLRLRDRRHLRDHGILLVGAVDVIPCGECWLARDDGVFLLGARGTARTAGGGALAAVVRELAWGREPPVRPSPSERLNFRCSASVRNKGGRGGESPPPKPVPPRAELPREDMGWRSWGEAALQRGGFLVGEGGWWRRSRWQRRRGVGFGNQTPLRGPF